MGNNATLKMNKKQLKILYSEESKQMMIKTFLQNSEQFFVKR